MINKPLVKDCINADQYRDLMIKWQSSEIDRLKMTLLKAQAMLRDNVRNDTSPKLSFAQLFKHRKMIAAINTALKGAE